MTYNATDYDNAIEHLLIAVGRGDSEDWSELVEVNGPLIRRCCRHCGVQPVDVDDISQEVWLSVYQNRLQFRRLQNADSFRAWIWTITRRKCIDLHRRRVPLLGIGGDVADGLSEPVAPMMSPADCVANQDEFAASVAHFCDIVRGCFNAIYVQIFEASVIQGGAAAEVAGELGVSVNLVYIARSRILARLREAGSPAII